MNKKAWTAGEAKESGRETGGWRCARSSGTASLHTHLALRSRDCMSTWQMGTPRHTVMPGLGFSAVSDLTDPRLHALSMGPHGNLGIWSSVGAWLSLRFSICELRVDTFCKWVTQRVENWVLSTLTENGVPREPWLCPWQGSEAKKRGTNVGVRQNRGQVLPFLCDYCVNLGR